MNRLISYQRWALAVAMVASLAWLAGCVQAVLGWRGPGDLFLAWSVPALPVFVATAEWWSRRRGRGSEPWLAALVVVWTTVLWSLDTHPRIPGSPGQFVAASIAVIVIALGLLTLQGAMLFTGRQPSAIPSVERQIAVATPVGAD